jgi:hypothetical protein
MVFGRNPLKATGIDEKLNEFMRENLSDFDCQETAGKQIVRSRQGKGDLRLNKTQCCEQFDFNGSVIARKENQLRNVFKLPKSVIKKAFS